MSSTYCEEYSENSASEVKSTYLLKFVQEATVLEIQSSSIGRVVDECSQLRDELRVVSGMGFSSVDT